MVIEDHFVIPDLPTTDWHPADMLPVRSGVYEIHTPPHRTFRYFDGRHWYTGSTSPHAAFFMFQMFGRPTIAQRWRGLTERHT